MLRFEMRSGMFNSGSSTSSIEVDTAEDMFKE